MFLRRGGLKKSPAGGSRIFCLWKWQQELLLGTAWEPACFLESAALHSLGILICCQGSLPHPFHIHARRHPFEPDSSVFPSQPPVASLTLLKFTARSGKYSSSLIFLVLWELLPHFVLWDLSTTVHFLCSFETFVIDFLICLLQKSEKSQLSFGGEKKKGRKKTNRKKTPKAQTQPKVLNKIQK